MIREIHSKHYSGIYASIPMVASAFADQFGTKIIWGTKACTDGNFIVLPSLGDDLIEPKKLVLWGYLAHEAGHIRFTDFEIRAGSPLLKHLVNILEDVRIEERMIDLYPGTRKTMDATARYCLDEGIFNAPDPSDPISVFTSWLLFSARAIGRKQDFLGDLALESAASLVRLFGSSFVSQADQLLNKVTGLGSTQDAFDLANDFIELLQSVSDDQDQSQGQDHQDQSQGQDQDQDQDQDQSQGQGQDQDQSSDSSLNSEPSSSDEDGSGDQDGASDDSIENASSSSSDNSGDDSADNSSSADLDSKSGQSASNQAKADEDETGVPDRQQKAQAILDTDDLEEDPMHAFHEDLFADASYEDWSGALSQDESSQLDLPQRHYELTNASAMLRNKLMKLVDNSRRSKVMRHDYGRLDHREIHRLPLGELDIFKLTKSRRAPNTAVHILGDYSYSMEGEEEFVAQACYNCATALYDINGVSPGVTYFGGGKSRPTVRILNHGENPRLHVKKFMRSANGTTPMAAALWDVAFELRKAKEPRKILVVFTDGDPDNFPATQEMLSKLSENIEIYGIGINHDISSLFQHSYHISSPQELGVAFDHLMLSKLVA